MATRAAELMKEKNCDLEFELFDADDGSCSGIGIAELYGEASGVVQRVIEGVVASFPDIEMREQVSANGELFKEYISENGKLVEVEIIDEEEVRINALRNCSDEELKELLSKTRQGDWNSQFDLIEALFWGENFEQRFSHLLPEDEQWLRPRAKKNDVRAITLLLVGMENRYRTWDDEFTDEDTGEPFTVIHAEKIEGNIDDIVIEGLTGEKASLSHEGGKIYLDVSALRHTADVTWDGGTDGIWDFAGKQNFLLADGTKDFFVTGDRVTFNDEAQQTTVTITEDVKPGNVVFDNTTKDYTLTGDGAIIGTNSVVAKDIPPYAIAVGNPCRVVRKRFDDELIEILLKLRWWDKSIEEIENLMPILSCSDLEKVKEELKTRV